MSKICFSSTFDIGPWALDSRLRIFVKNTAFQPIKSGLSSFDKKRAFFSPAKNFFCNDPGRVKLGGKARTPMCA
jgi:hypothetical protein